MEDGNTTTTDPAQVASGTATTATISASGIAVTTVASASNTAITPVTPALGAAVNAIVTARPIAPGTAAITATTNISGDPKPTKNQPPTKKGRFQKEVEWLKKNNEVINDGLERAEAKKKEEQAQQPPRSPDIYARRFPSSN